MLKYLMYAAIALAVTNSGIDAGKPIQLSTGHTTDEMARSTHPPE
jgi:hypothetical protein